MHVSDVSKAVFRITVSSNVSTVSDSSYLVAAGTTWAQSSPSSDAQVASQCRFLTTLMPPLSVFSACFFGLFSYLRENDKISMSFLRFNLLLPLLLRSLFDWYYARKLISALLLLRGIYISPLSESERCTGYDDSREQRYHCTVRLTISRSYSLFRSWYWWRQEPLWTYRAAQ